MMGQARELETRAMRVVALLGVGWPWRWEPVAFRPRRRVHRDKRHAPVTRRAGPGNGGPQRAMGRVWARAPAAQPVALVSSENDGSVGRHASVHVAGDLQVEGSAGALHAEVVEHLGVG